MINSGIIFAHLPCTVIVQCCYPDKTIQPNPLFYAKENLTITEIISQTDFIGRIALVHTFIRASEEFTKASQGLW